MKEEAWRVATDSVDDEVVVERVRSMLAGERASNGGGTRAAPPNPVVVSAFKSAVARNLGYDDDGDSNEDRRQRLKTLFLMIAHERDMGIKRLGGSSSVGFLGMAHALMMTWYSFFPDDVFALVDRLAEMDGASDLFAPPRVGIGLGLCLTGADEADNLVHSYFRSEDLFNGHPLLLKLLGGRADGQDCGDDGGESDDGDGESGGGDGGDDEWRQTDLSELFDRRHPRTH